MAESPPVIGRVERLWRHAGLWCLAVGFYHTGTRCGYVLVEEAHPWHGLRLRDEAPSPRDLTADPVDVERRPIVHMFAASLYAGGLEAWARTLQSQLRVHGGLSFADEVDWNEVLEDHDGVPVGWWLGFDAFHAGDAPDMELLRDEDLELDAVLRRAYGTLMRGRVWTTDEIVTETELLADQIAAARRPAGPTDDTRS